MGRARKIHVQQSLLNLAGTKFRDRRGGKRRGAGRKPTPGRRAGTPHRRRSEFRADQPLHVTLRVLPVVGKLRRMDIYKACNRALRTCAKHAGFRVVHVSIQNTHLHLLVEASNRRALSRGVAAFKISAAKWINRALWDRTGSRRKGSVFSDRYYDEVITSPRQARNALAYVLNNWRRHREDTNDALVDKFSSGIRFNGWSERSGRGPWATPAGYEPLAVSDPQSWLLRVGWRKHGLVSVYERPAQQTR